MIDGHESVPFNFEGNLPMLVAVLNLSDFAVIALIVALVSGTGALAQAARSADRRSSRLEAKVDLILAHLGIEYALSTDAEWQKLAAQPGMKIFAIKAYREAKGVGLAEAKKAVEDYMKLLPEA